MTISRLYFMVPPLALAVLGLTGCQAADGSRPASADITTTPAGFVRLDEAQRERLGIQIASVKRETAHSTISGIGWLTLPPTGETIVRAPLSGFVAAKLKQKWPALGQEVSSGQALAQLNVFLSPQEVSQLVQAKEENDIQIQQSLVTMNLTAAQLERLTNAREAVTGIRMDQLKEAYERSKAAYKESQDKVPFLIQEPYDNGVVGKPISIDATKTGRVLHMFVTEGQFVQTGDPLWTVADWSTLWVRVPVFDADAQRVDPTKPAEIRDRKSGTLIVAVPISVPRETKAGTRTLDFYYSITNPDWKLRVGQSTAVELPIGDEVQVLMIPRSSILYDGFGQAYCYTSVAGQTQFLRRRVELGALSKDRVIISRGLDVDDSVVSIGAEQLAAEESKGELSVGDDD